MRSPDNANCQPHLKHDLDRQLRSTSPAVKRPASDMGAQDREDHGDVKMHEADSGAQPTLQTNSSDLKAKQQYTDEHHHDPDKMKDILQSSHPSAVSQNALSDSTDPSISDSLLPTPSIRSTAATSVVMDIPPFVFELPSIDEQKAKVTDLLRRDPQEKEKGYVVSMKWLMRVLSRSSEPPQIHDKSATEGDIGPVDNSDLAIVLEDYARLTDQAGENFVALKPGLQLEVDYTVLTEEPWQLIISWYGLAKDSPVITRYAYDVSAPDSMAKDMKWEADPPIFSFLKVPAEHTVQTQREADLPPARIIASKYMQSMEWLRQAKKATHIDMTIKVRPWRILGGLKNTHTSGMITPAASRSASPAPGAEITVSAGDRMLLDVNTFAALSLGDQREKLDIEDQTSNLKYNGSSTLALIGIGRSDVVVLEEQKGGPGGGEWPSEHTRVALPKNARDKVKGLTPSGRTSPAPGSGPTTRGRSMREGRPKGITGLSNLGNTCYMNSALQSLRSVRELTEYFLHDEYKKELNKTNVLGHNGQVALAYGQLIHQIYDDGGNSCSPSKFKQIVGKYGPSFSGYQQQDSQEFLLFLLDGLSEDLNRIYKKPYIEKPDSTDEMVHDHQALQEFADRNWADYKARNDSVVTDLFAGMYKSTLTCPECSKVSIIFDPFSNLTLQLPIENNWAKDVAFVPLYGRPIRMQVEIDKNSSIRTLKEFVARRTNTDPDLLVVAEDYKNRFYRIFDNTIVMSEANIQANDVICVFQLESKPTNYNPDKVKKTSYFSGVSNDDDVPSPSSAAADEILVPIFHRVVKNPSARIGARPYFGLPSFIVLNREQNKSYETILKKILARVHTMTTKDVFEDGFDSADTTPEDSDTVVMTDDGSGSGPTTSSDQNEDGFVNVSMRDASVAPASTRGNEETRIKRILDSDTPVPEHLKSLFIPCVQATGEGIPTGWNQLNENSDYTSLLTRVPKQVSHRPANKRSQESSDEDADSESCNGDLPDIEHDEGVPSPADSSSESTASAQPPSMTDSEDVSELHDMAKSRGQNKHHRHKIHKRKGKTIQGKALQQRKPAPHPTFSRPAPMQKSETGLIIPGEALILDWSSDSYEALFGGSADDDTDFRGAATWKSVPELPDPELTAKRALRAARRKNGISLEDCLNEFGKPETLSEQNAWYCPRCKEHRRAEKKFELWKAPDILVMHLKRFSSNRNFRDKLDVRVEYPIEGLDMTEMVQNTEGKSMIYDLIAVDMHFGGLGGGHYTAYAKHALSGNWYEYNDASVSPREPHHVVTANAYLLFYRRRGEYPLGGPRLVKALSEADSESQQESREMSPAGEGRRLGGSSYNGSSSAFQAGPAHLVGDGGLGRNPNRGLTPEDENQQRSIEMETEPPSYHAATGQPSPPDEAIDMDEPQSTYYGPVINPGWGFDRMDDMFGDQNGRASSNSSTRVAGSPQSFQSLEDRADAVHWSDVTQDDFTARSMRESAPPPDFEPTVIEPVEQVLPSAENEDDDDLPVVELKTDEDGDMHFTQAPN